MKRFAEQFKKKAEGVRLRTAERRDLRDRLVSYIEYHPLTKTDAQKNAEQYIRSEEFTALKFNFSKIAGYFSAFAVLLLILVPIAAERALPGDVLYPIKVNINEEIRSSLASSPYEQVEWETERLERRIAEARLLAREGRLTEAVEAEVAEAVKQHSEAAQQNIATIRETDSDGAAIAEVTFESALSVQSEVLEGELKKAGVAVSASSTNSGSSVAGLAGIVSEVRENVSDRHSGITPSYEKLAARLELETTRAFELFESVKKTASDDEVADVERRLSDIGRKIKDARTQHEARIEGEDHATSSAPTPPEIALLLTALSDLQKLISFMTNIDVRENVEIEELVPISLTDEERTAAVLGQLSEVNLRIEALNEALAEREEDDRTEKLEEGVAEATELASTSQTALDAEEFAAAERAVTEARAILSDIRTLVGDVSVPELQQEDGEGTTTGTTSTTTPEIETGTSTGTRTEGVSTSTTGLRTEAGTSTGTTSRATTTGEREGG